MNHVTAILPAAGLGTRMGTEMPKQFLELDGVPLLIFTLRRLAACRAITDYVIATRAEEVDAIAASVAQENLGRPVRVVRGGDTRQDSVANALPEVPPDADLILVHDAVRPLVTQAQIECVVAEALSCDAAILGVPAMDTVKEVKRGAPQSGPGDVALITATIPRERIVLAQTPQVFRASLLLEAFAKARQDGVSASDEAGLIERMGRDVHVVAGSERNLKITRPGDMQLAEFYLREERASR
jgi:2-C-methyl-D-erythritol 4-phosphate cytidylyltransferase